MGSIVLTPKERMDLAYYLMAESVKEGSEIAIGTAMALSIQQAARLKDPTNGSLEILPITLEWIMKKP